jgi:hypothetical protein
MNILSIAVACILVYYLYQGSRPLKRQKGGNKGVVIALVLLLAGGGVAAYFLLKKGKCTDFKCPSGQSLKVSPSPCQGRTCTPTECCDAKSAKSCDTSAEPTNGTKGDCTATLASGSSCQPTCSAGYTVSGKSSCKAGKLTAATCTWDGHTYKETGKGYCTRSPLIPLWKASAAGRTSGKKYTQRGDGTKPPTDLKPGEYWTTGDTVKGCNDQCSKLKNCDAFIRYPTDACYLFKLNDTDKKQTSQPFSGTPVKSKCYIK